MVCLEQDLTLFNPCPCPFPCPFPCCWPFSRWTGKANLTNGPTTDILLFVWWRCLLLLILEHNSNNNNKRTPSLYLGCQSAYCLSKCSPEITDKYLLKFFAELCASSFGGRDNYSEGLHWTELNCCQWFFGGHD